MSSWRRAGPTDCPTGKALVRSTPGVDSPLLTRPPLPSRRPPALCAQVHVPWRGSGGRLPPLSPLEPGLAAHPAVGSGAHGSRTGQTDRVLGGHCTSVPTGILPQPLGGPGSRKTGIGVALLTEEAPVRSMSPGGQACHTRKAGAPTRKASTEMSQAGAIPGDTLPRTLPQQSPEISVPV